jgi:hypothetical protein
MQTTRRKTITYPGELGAPIKVVPPLSPFENPLTGTPSKQQVDDYERQQVELRAAISEKFKHKLSLLLTHFAIRGDDPWYELALTLAHAHVPGFYVVGPHRRRLKIWTREKLLRLLVDVGTVKKQRLCTDKAACRFLANSSDHRPAWGRPKNHKGTTAQWVETLETRLQEARQTFKASE